MRLYTWSFALGYSCRQELAIGCSLLNTNTAQHNMINVMLANLDSVKNLESIHDIPLKKQHNILETRTPKNNDGAEDKRQVEIRPKSKLCWAECLSVGHGNMRERYLNILPRNIGRLAFRLSLSTPNGGCGLSFPSFLKDAPWFHASNGLWAVV